MNDTQIAILMTRLEAVESQVARLTEQLGGVKPAIDKSKVDNSHAFQHPNYTDEEWEKIKNSPRIPVGQPFPSPVSNPNQEPVPGPGEAPIPGGGPGRPKRAPGQGEVPIPGGGPGRPKRQ